MKSGAVSGPALINIADGTGRYVSAIGEIGNLRDHIATVDLGLIGDVDRDGDVDAVDALFILQHVVGLRPVLCPTS